MTADHLPATREAAKAETDAEYKTAPYSARTLRLSRVERREAVAALRRVEGK